MAPAAFRDLPWDGRWLTFRSLLAEVIHDLGDRRRAAQLYTLLRPYAHRLVVAYYQTFGSVAHFLGLLAVTTGGLESAERHFAEALRVHQRLDMLLWRLHTQVSMADVAARHCTPEGHRLAQETLDATEAEAAPLGLVRVLRRVEQVRSTIDTRPK